ERREADDPIELDERRARYSKGDGSPGHPCLGGDPGRGRLEAVVVGLELASLALTHGASIELLPPEKRGCRPPRDNPPHTSVYPGEVAKISPSEATLPRAPARVRGFFHLSRRESWHRSNRETGQRAIRRRGRGS